LTYKKNKMPFKDINKIFLFRFLAYINYLEEDRDESLYLALVTCLLL